MSLIQYLVFEIIYPNLGLTLQNSKFLNCIISYYHIQSFLQTSSRFCAVYRKFGTVRCSYSLFGVIDLYRGIRIGFCMSSSVADPGCLSRIPDPDFYPSRILDPGSLIPDLESWIPDSGPVTKNSNQRGRGKNFLSYLFL
jgi:hypothetical protein